MAIKIANPKDIGLISKEDTFAITSVIVDLQRKSLISQWTVKDVKGKILKAGIAKLIDSKNSTPFTDFYNNWTTTEQLYSVVSALAGYSGQFQNDPGLN